MQPRSQQHASSVAHHLFGGGEQLGGRGLAPGSADCAPDPSGPRVTGGVRGLHEHRRPRHPPLRRKVEARRPSGRGAVPRGGSPPGLGETASRQPLAVQSPIDASGAQGFVTDEENRLRPVGSSSRRVYDGASRGAGFRTRSGIVGSLSGVRRQACRITGLSGAPWRHVAGILSPLLLGTGSVSRRWHSSTHPLRHGRRPSGPRRGTSEGACRCKLRADRGVSRAVMTVVGRRPLCGSRAEGGDEPGATDGIPQGV